MKSLILSIWVFLSLLIVQPGFAGQVTLEVAKGINATAEYHQGEPDKPLLLFIHGFLQTYEFSTVYRLSSVFKDEGYAVLSPNLSLAVNNRKKSLACEAIHLHSLTDEAEEILAWVEWAKAKGHNDIILIGHSAGSVSITAYLASHQHPAVNKTILISLTYFGEGRPAAFETEKMAVKARQLVKNNDQQLNDFALSYCKKYITTAAHFLSYYDWSDAKVLQALKRSHTDNYIIVGSNDQRIGKRWLEQLQSVYGNVLVVDGANHFFDQAHEFDLVEAVESILEED